jgi:TolA-binding protein
MRRTILFLTVLLTTTTTFARLGPLEQISIETFASLREVERYQLKIAEKHYLKGEWKVAASEYEKFLTLYERSAAAPYAQLMWSICQVKLRRVHTGIKEGFQSVIDYWPDAPEAVVARFKIASSYKLIGDIRKAKKAYAGLIIEHPEQFVAALAKVDLIDIARIEEDFERRVELWKDLTFKTKRKGPVKDICVRASRHLASHHFHRGSYKEAREALEASYKGSGLLDKLYDESLHGIRHLSRASETRTKGHGLADRIIADIKEGLLTDVTEDKAKAKAKAKAKEKAKEKARGYWYRIANVHGYAYRDRKVLEIYEKIMELFGSDDDVLGKIASWFKSHKRRDEARVIYGRFENQIRGQSLIAGMHREEGKYDLAIGIYRSLMEKDADHADSWQWQIAECYDTTKKYKEAIQTYRQCDRFPENYNRMARCHRRLKAYKEALVLYHQVMSHKGSAPEALLQIGHTYEESGKKEKAIKSFQQVCKRFPKSGQASRSHAHLQNAYKITVTLGGAKDE